MKMSVATGKLFNSKKLYPLLFLILVASHLYAQTGSIEGDIEDHFTHIPIENVSVSIPSLNKITSSNKSGHFILHNIPDGDYHVIFSAIGYRVADKYVELRNGQVIDLKIALDIHVTALPEVIVQGSGFTANGTLIKEIPGSAHFISPKEIEKFSYTDINHTLRTIPGINLQEEDGFGLRPNIGIRGTGVERSSKITIMEDGVLSAPAPYAAPAAYYFPTIGLMQGVEILKGSSQIKYGPYTTGGAINLITHKIPSSLSGKINILGGSYGGNNIHAQFGNSHGQIGYSIESFNYSSNGFKELPSGSNTGFDKQDYRLKMRWSTRDEARKQQALLLKLGYSEEHSNETYLGLTDFDFMENPYLRYAASEEDHMITNQQQISLRHFIQVSNILNVTTTIYHHHFERNWYKLDVVEDSLGTHKISDVLANPLILNNAYQILKGNQSDFDALGVKANNRSYYSRGVESKLNFEFENEFFSHDIEMGLRLHEDQIDRFQWMDYYEMNNGIMFLTTKGTPGTESNRIETANAFASYFQYEVRAGRFILSPGVRYEHVTIERQDYGKEDPQRNGSNLAVRSNNIDAFIPGMGINFQLSENASTFAGIHKGFAPPGSKEGTHPEQSVNYEIGYRIENKKISGEVIGFYSDYSNLLGSDLSAAGGSGSNDLFNGGEVEVYGIESKILLKLFENSVLKIPFTLVYTYTNAYFNNSFESDFEGWGDVKKGDDLPYLANHQVGTFVSVEHDQFNFNLSGKYISEMRSEPGQGEIPGDQKTDAVITLDASASYIISNNVSLFSNVINLTNEVFVVSRRPAGLRPGMPRAFNIGIKARF